MSVQLKGITSLTSKLNKLSNIKAKNAIEEVAKEVEKGLREEAGKFSKDGSKHIAQVETREYKNGNYFVDIGLKNEYSDWENWKHLYFHHYGYNQFFFGKPTGKFTNKHQFWFTNAIDSMEQDTLKKIKKKLREEIKEAMK